MTKNDALMLHVISKIRLAIFGDESSNQWKDNAVQYIQDQIWGVILIKEREIFTINQQRKVDSLKAKIEALEEMADFVSEGPNYKGYLHIKNHLINELKEKLELGEKLEGKK